MCNYQSKRRCAKTMTEYPSPWSSCNYQSKRRCAKTQFALYVSTL